MKFNAMVMISGNTLYSAWVPQLSQLEAADALKMILSYDIASQLMLKEAKRELSITFESDPPPAPASLERFDSLLGHQSNDLKFEGATQCVQNDDGCGVPSLTCTRHGEIVVFVCTCCSTYFSNFSRLKSRSRFWLDT